MSFGKIKQKCEEKHFWLKHWTQKISFRCIVFCQNQWLFKDYHFWMLLVLPNLTNFRLLCYPSINYKSHQCKNTLFLVKLGKKYFFLSFKIMAFAFFFFPSSSNINSHIYHLWNQYNKNEYTNNCNKSLRSNGLSRIYVLTS